MSKSVLHYTGGRLYKTERQYKSLMYLSARAISDLYCLFYTADDDSCIYVVETSSVGFSCDFIFLCQIFATVLTFVVVLREYCGWARIYSRLQTGDTHQQIYCFCNPRSGDKS